MQTRKYGRSGNFGTRGDYKIGNFVHQLPLIFEQNLLAQSDGLTRRGYVYVSYILQSDGPGDFRGVVQSVQKRLACAIWASSSSADMGTLVLAQLVLEPVVG